MTELALGADAVLSALDPEQREVALAVRGPVCVLAGAGTGKTRAVVHRIAYAVATGVVRPDRVLAVTFTTRAAGELRGRLRQLGQRAVPGVGLDQVQARTFHSAALRQLTHFWPTAVGGQPPAVLESKVSLLAEAAKRLRLSADPGELRDAAAEIEWAKVSQVRPEEYALECEKIDRTGPLPAARLAELYASYEELRAQRHLVDFESVLELTAAILAGHQAAAAAVADRYRYFVVDEYQDVNPLQQLLLDQWLGQRDDVCVVGDPRQTIYSFAGATHAYLTRFPVRYPDATVIRLRRNYRSTPQVIALANRVFWRSEQRLAPQRPAGVTPTLTEYSDERAEAVGVADGVAGLIDSGLAAGQIAVLVRTNAMTARFEEALAGAGVAYQLRGVERFYERAEVKQAIGLLRAAARSASPDEDPAEQVRPVLIGLGLTNEPPAGRGRAAERWESLDALARLAEEFFAAHQAARLADLAAELQHRSAIGHVPDAGGVTLASLHAAKGLEWAAVFLPCLTDGALPISYAATTQAIEEERRLFYVGLTRARDRLLLSWAAAREPGGRGARSPSRFLADIGSAAAKRRERQ
ncbi:MAG TPA: ATP-dependent helicase [Streptosporangiaceae bacterium]|nr:ATP-dependent helicase [Streptosporangiaceae bacterium]